MCNRYTAAILAPGGNTAFIRLCDTIEEGVEYV
jgi:hypothetical protein